MYDEKIKKTTITSVSGKLILKWYSSYMSYLETVTYVSYKFLTIQ